jgi:putative intracellular protease/amidase/anti-sigma regulatory factor (Ser/Thr protein kinase)
MLMNTLTVPANLDSLDAVADFVLAAADAADLSRQASYRLRLSVDEFVTNIILYAYAGAAAPGMIEIRALRDEKVLRVILEDTGMPFDPRQVAPPRDLHLPAEERRLGGLGIYLALGGVDGFAYERVGNRNRNCFIMNRPAAPPASPPTALPRRAVSAAGFVQPELTAMPPTKGKIGVLIEAHFDETEARRFQEFFPANGYAVEYLSHLWGQAQLTFKGNDSQDEVIVRTEVNDVSPADYAGLILIGGYAMDRLRYEENPREGCPNQAPAVQFLCKMVTEMDRGRLRIGAICHGLWLFCAAPELLKGRHVTCAHNIISDVVNAGGRPVYEGNRLKDVWVDGNLITGRHPAVVDEFMKVFLQQIEST